MIRKRLTRGESQMQTQEHLIEAARCLFVQHGVGGASIRAIAEEAGYSQGAFYSNFTSKEGVLLELLRRHMSEEVRRLDAVLETAGASGDVLSSLDRWAETLTAEADWWMLAIELQLHAHRSPAFAAEYLPVLEAYQAELSRIITHLFNRLDRPLPADPRALAAVLVAVAHGLALQSIGRAPDPIGPMVMVVLRSLLGATDVRRSGASG